MCNPTESAGAEPSEAPQLTKRQRYADIAWKVAVTIAVTFLIYSMLHLMDRLIELQGS